MPFLLRIGSFLISTKGVITLNSLLWGSVAGGLVKQGASVSRMFAFGMALWVVGNLIGKEN